MLILERPWTSEKIALYARQNGRYTRPIIGSIVDLRIEEFLPKLNLQIPHIIGLFPDIPQANQLNKHFIVTFNSFDRVEPDSKVIWQLLSTGQYLYLPVKPHPTLPPHIPDLWEYTKAPWWEWAVVLDEYDGFIKAPKVPRADEPNPDEIDERLDEYPENHGVLEVISPTVLEKWKREQTREPYQRRLQRIA